MLEPPDPNVAHVIYLQWKRIVLEEFIELYLIAPKYQSGLGALGYIFIIYEEEEVIYEEQMELVMESFLC